MKIGCVILAGGKSSRMGSDKALLEIEGTIFIKKIGDELSWFDEKIIARGNNCEIPDISWAVIPDIYPEHGPIGGMHAALSVCKSDSLFFVTCDMPLIQSTLAKLLCEKIGDGYDAVVAVSEDGRIHPLCGVYRKSVSSLLEKQILEGNNKIMAALEKMRVKYVKVHSAGEQLSNINTLTEYNDLKKQFRK